MDPRFWLLTGALAVAISGCKSSNQTVKDLTVQESAAAHQSGNTLFVDANDADYRKANGKVPGALLLANYREYDARQVLPADPKTPLVFYCSSRL